MQLDSYNHKHETSDMGKQLMQVQAYPKQVACGAAFGESVILRLLQVSGVGQINQCRGRIAHCVSHGEGAQRSNKNRDEGLACFRLTLLVFSVALRTIGCVASTADARHLQFKSNSLQLLRSYHNTGILYKA